MRTTHALLVLGALCLVAGCSDVSKKDLDDTQARLEAEIARSIAQVEQKINATDAKYANMLALEQSVKNGVEKIDQNAKLLENAGKAWMQVLQAHRNVLREQLKSIEDQIDALQNKS